MAIEDSRGPQDPDRARAMRAQLEQDLLARAGIRQQPAGGGGAAETPGAPAVDLRQRVAQDVGELAVAAFGIPLERFDAQRKLSDYGVDSIAITELMAQISRRYGVSIAPTTFFEARHVDELCGILHQRYGEAIARHYGAADAPPAARPRVEAAPAAVPAPAVVPARASAPAPAASTAAPADGVSTQVAGWIARHRGPARPAAAVRRDEAPAAPAAEAAPIAIISMDGVFPGSPDLEALREHLRRGDDCIEEIPSSRWDWRALWGDPRHGLHTDVKYGGFIAGHDLFDAPFFQISRKEAELIDPQHRLFMECVWRLFERAGMAPASLAGRKVAMFVGVNLQDYADLANRSGAMDAVQMTGLGHAFCPNRLSFLLGLTGPSQVIDTACSSSLVALHRAVMSIRHEGCELAVAGGSNLMLTPTQHVLFSKIGMLARDGRSKAFSASADGYSRAEGVAALLLKRLDLAQRDGDPILAVIRGSAENHGGAATSLTAPNPRAQSEVIVAAHRQAGIDPRTVTLLECHGTGTRLGDPVEIEGLKAAFSQLYADRALPPPAQPHCGIGSIKSNMGHAETAAGVAGVIKVVLALQDRTRYRTLHCEQPNPLIELAGTPFELQQQAQPWQRPVVDGREQPRRAGVSSFGAGGALAHVVLEEHWPTPQPVAPRAARPLVIPLSARDDASLRAAAAALDEWLAREAPVDDARFESLAFTLQVGRDGMRARLACVASDARELSGQLQAFLAGREGAVASATVPRGSAPQPPASPQWPPGTLARAWVGGAPLDWPALWAQPRPRRIALPTYPFQRQRYWLPTEPATPQPATTGHWPQMRETAPRTFSLVLRGDEPFLRDHRVQGVPVLPGVAYLELAREAAQRSGLAPCSLRKVVWLRPLGVAAPVTVQVRLLGDGGDWPRVEIATTEGADGLHMQARLGPAPAEAPAAVPLAALQASLQRRHDATELYARFDRMGLGYGATHRTLQSLASGSDAAGDLQVLGELQLAPSPAAADGFVLPPGLLDGALQACIGMHPDAAAAPAALPFALERLEIHGACTPRMWARVRLAADAAPAARLRPLDVDLLDEAGVPRVVLRGFVARAAEEQGGRTLLFEPRWLPLERAATTPSIAYARRLALVCAPEAAQLQALAARLPAWEWLALGSPSGGEGEAFIDAAAQLLAVLQAAVREPAGPVLLQVAATAGSPYARALAAMLRSARLEHPLLCAQLVVTDRGADGIASALELAALVPERSELQEVGGQLQGRSCVPMGEVAASDPVPGWRADGAYLITGGAGRLARAVATDITTRCPGASVVLAGRHAPAGEAASWLAQQQADGAKVAYRVCDVADLHAVEALVADLQRQHGRLAGVFHAAGVVRDGALARKTPAALREVLAPKVLGALHLDRALADAPLDCFVLFASLAGVTGNTGQADYATANAWLDVFAQQREAQRAAGRRHGRTVAIDWPLWREGGMRMEPAALRLMRQTTGLDELQTVDGLRALARALAGEAPQVIVAAGDAVRVRRHFESLEAAPLPARAAPQPVAAATAGDGRELRARMLAELTRLAATQLKVAAGELDPDVELAEYGFDSIGFTQFANQLNERLGLEITPTLFFEHPRLQSLAEALAASDGERIAAHLGWSLAAMAGEPVHNDAAHAPDGTAQPMSQPPAAPAAVVTSQGPHAQRPPGGSGNEPAAARAAVAVIGMAGVFPQARDIEQFWRNLAEGRDCISEVPPDRWDWRDYWGDPQAQPGRTNVRWGGFVDGIGEFDPLFFGLSPREARAMDPQQRLLLTQAWRVMEHAGYAPSDLAGSNTAVFIGTADVGYGRLLAQAGASVEGYSMTGLAPSLGPNRISFQFDFHGPSVAVETACSSALVAIHRAAESIRDGTCDTAIAGGINCLLLPEAFVGFTRAGMLAPDGRCKPFSAAANGYARGEGIGLVFLKRLDLAERDGDRILGVIRASAENHGGRAGSLTAPNPKAQADLLRTAWRHSGIDPRTVSYIEAHGTGTPLGDPIEVQALLAAFADLEREASAAHGPQPGIRCGLGAVKSSIGHLELAAGAAGLIKVLLQMEHGTLAPTLHCRELNPYLKLEGSRFEVVRERTPWRRPLDAQGRELPLRAGVSSFGFGGSNAHVVVEEYRPPVAAPAPAARPQGRAAIVLSARTPEQLAQWAGQLAAAVTPAMPLDAVAWTLQAAREPMEHRVAFLASSTQELRSGLAAAASGEAAEGLWRGRVNAHRDTLALLDGDEEMRRAIASLPARGKHDSLLQLWVRGLKVDWSALYPPGSRPPRLDLPGYPFATDRYWVDSPQGTAPPSATPLTPAAAVALDTVAQPPVMQPAAREPAVGVDRDERPVQPTVPEPPAAVSGYERALHALTQLAAQVLEVDPSVLEPDSELGDYGFDSITMTGFASKTNESFGLSLTPADFFEFATLARLARHLQDEPAFTQAPAAQPEPAAQDLAAAGVAPAAGSHDAATVQPQRVGAPNASTDPIAIVGLSCRLPMASDSEAFWRNLVQGRDCIEPVPPDRWDWRAIDGDPKTQPGRTNVHSAGFIDGVYEFDPLFFGISPREALLMDPQQRLLLLHVWKALEDAGHAPRSLRGERVGLFVGTTASGYCQGLGAEAGAEGYAATGATPSVGPNRVSYLLDWHGPSEPIETACSSSLVALHRAVQAMEAGDCNMAVVGGVNTILTPEAHVKFAKAGMLAPDGRCKTFSAEANGYGRGEGVVCVVLRRLSDAQRDGDPVYAVVRGSAVNHGGRANSLTAPNTAAQADVLRAAYARAGIDPSTITYVEAHGTGTALGDPVEVNALKSVFGGAGGARCGLGSVKTNIGHLELAAGLAGVAKVLLQMRHRTLVPSLHCAHPNPYIDFAGSPFFVVGELQPWPAARDAAGRELPLRAGVSSFGFGGVNAHVVLEQAPATSRAESPPAGAPQIVVLSARDPQRLREQAQQLLAAVAARRLADADLADIAWTLQVGREAMPHRLALVVQDLEQLREGLQAWLDGRPSAVASGKAAAQAGAAGGSPHDVAAQWVLGASVDWAARQPAPRKRLNLPTYPFERQTYRADAPPAVPPPPALVTGPGPDGTFALALDADAFYLADHRVNGARVLPGAMTLELVRMASRVAAGAAGFVPVSLEQVVWLAPLTGDVPPVVAAIALQPADAGRQQFELRSCGSVLAQGRVGPLVTPADAPRLDVQARRTRCPVSLDPATLYGRFAELGLAYGPAFRALAEVHSGDGEVLARLQLPPAARSEHAWAMHPVLLDAAFQACIGLFERSGPALAAVPFAVQAVHVLGPTPDALWASVRSAGPAGAVRRIDIDLADADGVVCVQVRGFALRLMAPPPKTAPAGAAATATAAAIATSPATTAAAVRSAEPAAAASREALVRYLVRLVAAESGVDADAIDADAGLDAYGIDSILITRLTDRLEQDFGPLSKTLFFEHQTLHALADHFLAEHPAQVARVAGGPAGTSGASAAPAAAMTPRTAGEPVASVAAAGDRDAIAIVGLAGRYPGASTLGEFWSNLAAGRDCVTEVPAARWDHARYYDPTPGTPGKANSKWGGFLDGADCFDPLFFNISPREAAFMDPQERLFLQCAWEAVEDAGYTRAALARGDAALPGARVGVFVGVMYEEYQLYGAESTLRGQPMALPGSPASIANRVSYFLNLHGPSLAVDTMCSSSLSAIHLACDSLRSGSCEAAIAGGVNLTLHPNKYLALAQGRFTSPRGRCESFGAAGEGYVPGEGVGAVLLKPLQRALADGDQVWGVIRGSALNHGGKTNGYSVPNPHAQTAVVQHALARAGVAPADVSYVEAHGTGTSLGDPIEIAALARAFGGTGLPAGSCAIGSVKSNIGHCESAAGIAGLTKVLLQLRHGQLVPSLHSANLNPRIDFARTPFVVQQALAPWTPRVADSPGGPRPLARVAGVSSFGAGGANAHLVIEEHVAPPRPAALPVQPLVFPVSVREAQRLPHALRRLRQAVHELEDDDLPSIAHVLQHGREAFEVRMAVVADRRAALLQGLDALLSGAASPAVYRAGDTARQPRGEDRLAASWVAGEPVAWALGGSGPVPRKISLPTYPFASERHWAPAAPVAGQAEARVAPAAAPASMPPLPLLYVPRWEPAGAAANQAPPTRTVVVLCEPAPDAANRLAAGLPEAELVVLEARNASHPACARYADHASQLLELVQRVARERRPGTLLQVVVPDGGEQRLFEGLCGLLLTAGLEIAGLRGQLVAIDTARDDLAAVLRAERATGDALVRHGAGGRLVRQWAELAPAGVPAASAWRDGGVYLITGGAGGVGLLLAQDIARRVRQPVLCLTSRSALSPAAAQQLQALPATVLHRQVDVTDADAMAALVRELLALHGRIDGVVHAAGLLRDKGVLRKRADELREVLAPKVAGLDSLDRATAGVGLGFMLLFASAAGALGNPGQVDYATGNAFMDAFAAWRNERVARGERRGRTLAIDWPYWEDGGMRLDAQTLEAMRTGFGVAPLATEAAMAALQVALAGTDPQVLVLAGDPARLRSAMGGLAAQAPAAPGPAQGPAAARSAAVEARGVAAVDPQRLRPATVDWLARCVGEVIGMDPGRIGVDEPFDRYGMDSVFALQVIERMERELGPLPRTLVFEYPRIGLLADALLDSHAQALAAKLGDSGDPPPQASAPVPQPADAVAVPGVAGTGPSRDVAVIAVSGRYPGADDVEAFWELLRDGRDCITEVPAQRWDAGAMFSADKGRRGTSHCKWGGFLADADCFDASFFGLTPREALLMDPQERLFLQEVWHLLERAGVTREQLQARYEARVGVYVGAMFHPDPTGVPQPEDRAMVSLASHASIANRVSFWFDLQGPSVAVDSMCSSGLQAVHEACRSLQLGECRLAIAGGVNLTLHPHKYLGLARAGLLGSAPSSRSFAEGDGYLPAEGVGVVLLKPLADAQRDGDPVLAVIKGSAANHAGRSGGFGVPSAQAQARLIEENFRASGVDPRTLGYVEAAATGSALGDAIELRALTRAFRAFTGGTGFCAIGSVKSNMGHAESASGMAQLTKVLLQLQHAELAPTLQPAVANAGISFGETPFRLQLERAPWARPVIDGVEVPRRAAVSSFGAGGSNVHVILEEAPAAPWQPPAADAPRERRFVLSARDPQRLAQMARLLHGFVIAQPALSLDRLSDTLCHRRERMECSVEFVAADRAELLALLDAGPPWPAPDPRRLQAALAHPAPHPLPPLVLPGYPFARERFSFALAAEVGPTEGAAAAAPAPAAVLEQITRTLCEELGLPPEAVRPDATFRDHGADSMFAWRLIHALSDVAGVTVTHRDLESHPTPRALARFAATLAPAAGARAPAPTPAGAAEPALASGMPLSEGQASLWVLQQLYPAHSGYNVPLAFRVEGIGRVALERTCRHMLERFPILSTVVEDSAGEPRLVQRAVEAPLQLLSVPPGLDDLAFTHQRAARPFRLEAEPPIRFELVLGNAEILLVVVHHIVFDGISAASFERAFWDAYERFFTGREPSAQGPDTEYPAFVAWERDFLRSAQGQADLAYWRGQLAGDLPVLQLPSDRPSAQPLPMSGRSIDALLAPERVQAARQCAGTLGIGLASFFLGVFDILLYRYCGQEDFAVAMPTAGRPSRRFERAIGYFANLVLLRMRVSGTLRAADLLRQAHAQLVEGLDHASYPFAALARQLPRSADGAAPYQVSYSYQNFLDGLVPGSVLTVGGTRITHLPQLRQEGDGAFGLEVVEEGEQLRLVAVFDPGRFEESTARRMLDHFGQLVESIARDPSCAVGALDMMRGDELRAVLGWSRGPALPARDGHVVEWFLKQAAATPEATALVAGDLRIGYGELARRAQRLAAHLLARGVAPGSRVGVLLQRGADSIVTLLAVLAAGATWVPLEPADPDRRLSQLLQDAQLAALVTDASGSARSVALGAQVPLWIPLDREQAAIAAAPLPSSLPAIDPAGDAYVIHTSGSTGRPKGVAVTHAAIAAHCLAVADRYALAPRDVVLQFASHSVDTALEQILPTLAGGACLVLRESPAWTPAQLARVLHDESVTVADLPPAYLREVLAAWTDDPGAAPQAPSLRLLVVGGETLEPELVALWQRGPLAAARLLNAYGPTEATITCTVHDVASAPLDPCGRVPIGRPLAGGDVFILDRDGNPVPEGVPGELHVGGARVARAYLGRPELTRERFVASPLAADGGPLYRTGDLGCFIPASQGAIALRGRLDGQVKIRGFRIEPGDVEAALRDCGVASAMVLPGPSGAAQAGLTAFVVAPATLDDGALRRELAQRLPSAMVPSRIVRLDALPVTPGGKVDRAALAALAADAPAPQLPLVDASAVGREQALLGLWREVLGCPTLGLHDDFFRCGGHSLLALRLLARVRRAWGHELSIVDLLQAPTVAAQSALLAGRGSTRGVAEPTLVPLSDAVAGQRREPLFLVHPVGGSVLCYLELGRQLGAAQPVYGLQAATPALSSLEAMATAYVAAIRSLQPCGPYHLAGWSMGGVVAYEMAQQLQRAGEQVAFLGLIDSYTPALLAQVEAVAGEDPGEEVRLARAFARHLAAGAGASSLEAIPSSPENQRLFEQFRCGSLALQAYRPQPYAGPLTVLPTAQGRSVDPTLGWGALAAGALVLQPVGGDHYDVLRPPHLERVVQALRAGLGAPAARQGAQAAN